MIGSLKFKLVGTFLALSLLPLAAAYWSFSEVSDRSVSRGVDARLEAGLRAAVAAYADERREAENAARRLAREPAFQAALARQDRAALREILAATPNLRVETPTGFSVGIPRPLAAETRVSLVGPGASPATVVAAIPLGDELVQRLRVRSGLRPPDELVLVGGDGGVRASSAELSGRVEVPLGRVGTVAVGDESYRAVGVRIAPNRPLVLAVATPSSAIAGEQGSVRNRILAALAGSLLLIALVAYLAGRSIVGALARLAAAANSIAAGRLRERVPVRGRDEFAALGRAFNRMAVELEARVGDLEDQRRRLRDANARFGEALASTLDADQLRRVIVESAVEATHAGGGLLHASDGSVVSAGDIQAGPRRLEYELTAGRGNFGKLVLLGASFDNEATMTAASLAGQAVVALENAQLHRIVERQALMDDLTGLANRRQAEEALGSELARAERLGGSVGLILADLDDFKAINDRHGHPTGDVVLREFADVLLETVREIDVAARWGGEEFAVILPGTDLEGAAQLAERLRLAIAGRQLVALDGARLQFTASFGAGNSRGGTGLRALVEIADNALYRAKRAGKNRVYAGAQSVSPH